MEKNNVLTVIIIAHNDLSELKLCMEAIRNFNGLETIQSVVIDNASTDGTGEWLKEEGDIAYATVENEVEGFAKVLNTALKIFQIEGDILIMRPQHAIAPYCIEKLRKGLYSQDSIGAVGPLINGYKVSPLYVELDSYTEAIKLAERRKDSITVKRVLGIPLGMVMIKYDAWKKIQKFEEQLVSCDKVMTDYSIQLTVNGYELGVVEEAIAYCMVQNKKVNGYEKLLEKIDERKVLSAKWGMNYFNIIPNENLVEKIEKEEQEAFRVLEIGCDCGATLLAIKNKYSNAELYGYEINESAAKIAGSIAEVAIGNIEKKELNYKQEFFDYIILGDILEHLHDPEEVLRYLQEYLKDGGTILSSIPNLMHISVIRELLAGNFTYADVGLLDRTHIHMFTYNEIKKMFERTGYRIKEMNYTLIEMAKTDEAYIEKLLEMEPHSQRFWFEAYQYVVKAVKPRGLEKKIYWERRKQGKEHHIGTRQCQCGICGEINENKIYLVKEMMYALQESFEYFECATCGCMQIVEIPEDLGKYYGESYYSFSKNDEEKIQQPIRYTQSVLDVGCGSGKRLLEFAEDGYGELYGCDKFIEKDIHYGDRIHIKKCEIMDMTGEYDIILLMDSLEHMPNPLEVLQNVKRLLKKDGECHIKIPVLPNAAFEVLGENWFQLDAPRHLYIHTLKSMVYLCKQAGLQIVDVTYDSNNTQFAISYMYENGVPFTERKIRAKDYFTEQDVDDLNELAIYMNAEKKGDHACFFIKHIDD